MTGQVIEHDAPSELPSDIWTTNGGIYLGLTPEGRTNQCRPLAGKEEAASQPRYQRHRTTWRPDGACNLYQGEGHIGTWGPQGSGKSRKLLLPNLFKLRDWSIYVVDIKGELTAHSALYRSQQPGHQVHVIDPFGVIKREYPRLYAQNPALFTSKGYNHLGALQPNSEKFADDAKSLAMALINAKEARDPYWPRAAQTLTKGALMALRVDRPGLSDALGVFRAALGLPPQELCNMLKDFVEKHSKKHPAIAACLNEFTTFRPDDREIGGIRRYAKAETDWLDSPSMQTDLRQRNTIDFGSFRDRPQTCYVVLPPDELVNQAVWLQLMLTSALRPLLRSTHVARVPVLFMLDEFAAMGPMEFLQSNLNLLRGFGIKLWTVWQSVNQMEEVYPRSWKTFMGAAECKITFTSNDLETLDYFSRFAHERLYSHKTRSSSFNVTRSTSRSKNTGDNAQYINPFRSGYSTGEGNSTSTSTSENDSVSEQHLSERTIKPYELAALDADEAVIFSRRGIISRAICPQPEFVDDDNVKEAITAVKPLLQPITRPSNAPAPAGRPVSSAERSRDGDAARPV